MKTNEVPLRLNVKQTLLVGTAFLSIMAFWQMYNNVIPLILTNTFQMNESWSGVIMAADNVLGLILLPFFGGLSDNCRSPLGRRRPFILIGTVLSVLLMMALPLLDDSYASAPMAGKKTLFICILGGLLFAMSTYRSPSVALMPDVTPKPLRSKANALINLMGALGGILYLLIASLLYSKSRTEGLSHVSYLPLFLIVAVIMLTALVILLVKVPERILEKKVFAYEEAHPEENLAVKREDGREVLPREVGRSLILLLVSVFLWYFAYNSVETWYTVYAMKIWKMPLGSASLCLTIAMAGAILAYVPGALLADRIGRRCAILTGTLLLAAGFSLMIAMSLLCDAFHPAMFAIFVLIGIGWAIISVNSLPMVVEMCKGSELGRFTGYYYAFSMAAQTLTPVLAGTLMNRIGYGVLFPYAALFALLSALTISLVRHGDGRTL